jgi:hypothetical protein
MICCKEILAEYRAALPAVMTPEGLTRLRRAKTALQQRLCRVMARTERLASSNLRGGMLLDAPPGDASLLRRALAIYRMVFGQSRQEDLITYLLAQIPEDEREGIVAELQIDLSPANRKQHGLEHGGPVGIDRELAKLGDR